MLASLLDLFAFFAVMFRGMTLALSALTVGGVVFSVLTLRGDPVATGSARSITKRWTFRCALALVLVQSLWLAMSSAVLVETTGLSFSSVCGANAFVSGAVLLVAACAIALSLGIRNGLRPWLLAPAAAIVAAEVLTSHAMARVGPRGWPILLTTLHQAAAAVWIGGLLYWTLAVRATQDRSALQNFSRRFSVSAQISVPVLFLAGLGLSVSYVRSGGALVGTTYGVMLLAKVVLFATVLLLGGLNFLVVSKSSSKAEPLLTRFRALGEAEMGIGFTIILAAASLTAQPPAVDLANDRVDLRTIAERLSPRLPTLATPPLSSLSPSTRQLWKEQQREQTISQPYVPGSGPYMPPTPGDIAWSEYNHHWAGVVVLCAGILAVAARRRRARWSRHWPLAFCGLAVFLFVRADPENWPLGPNGFWESFSSADVLQHRLFVVLILAFACFEWSVQTGRSKRRATALVFPVICAAGGALLLTHSHALANIREEVLIEYSHLPLAMFAVAAGWGRWLELRLPCPHRSIPAKIWPVCLAMVGVVLVLYREA